MKKMSSRPVVFKTELLQLPDAALNKILVDTRNFLEPAEAALVAKEAKIIAAELRSCLDQSELDSIRSTPDEVLSFAHRDLGRAIRNEYELWLEGHHIAEIWRKAEREVPLASTVQYDCTSIDMTIMGRTVQITSSAPLLVDDHPCHPDNFSAYVLKVLKDSL